MDSKCCVLIPDVLSEYDIEKSVFNENTIIFLGKAKKAGDIPDETWRNADAILAWHELTYDRDLVNKLDKCKVIVRVGVGFDNVDLDACREKGIVVCNVPDYGTEDVADHAMAFILSLSRGLSSYNSAVANYSWNWKDAGRLRRLAGANLGIIGLGRIGTAVAMRAKGFGLNVGFYDPYVVHGQEKALGVARYGSLQTLLQSSDIVSIHTPLTEETREMANSEFFSLMKKGSLFINTARGGIIDIDSLYNHIKDGHIRAAGLDVLPQEPPDESHPLIKAWRACEPWVNGRLIITPHSAFYNQEAFEEMRRKAALEVKKVFDAKTPLNRVS